jgi:hypothetical protein
MYHKVDDTQQAIVKYLRSIPGVSVEPRLAQLGRGCPDILVGWMGKNHLYEIKVSEKEELTPDESKWHRKWAGRVVRVNCIEDICKDLGIMI